MTQTNNERDAFDLADKAIKEAYPDFNNKGNGCWGDERIPNYGILRGAIAKAIRKAQSPISKNEQQEAVGEVVNERGYSEVFVDFFDKLPPPNGTKLYTSPPKQAIPDGWKLISDELPITGIRVLIFTDGVDFNGEQYFDVQSDSLNEFFYESRHDMPEVCIHATHWMLLPTPTLKEKG